PFFYLDAHENELGPSSLPLKEEIEIILSLDEFVVMIDDFRIPLRDDYQAGIYAGVALEIGLLEKWLMQQAITSCYFPTYASAQDSGYQRGFCVFWRSANLDRAMERPVFPLTLMGPYSLGE